MHVTEPEEDTLLRAKLKFSCIEGSKIWPTCTTENTEVSIFRIFAKKTKEWRLIIDDSGRESVDEINSTNEGFSPKFERHASLGKEHESDLYDVPVLALSSSVLLVCVRTGYTVCDSNTLKEGIKGLIFPTPISLY